MSYAMLLQARKKLHIRLSVACAAFVFLVTVAFPGGCSPPAPDYAAIAALPIKNLNRPRSNVFAAGQPTVAELETLAGAGLKHIVNLRPRPEQADFDQASLVQKLGMRYYSVPVAGPAGLTAENAARLARVLDSIADEPVLVHCSSGNRVGALIAIHEHRGRGLNLDDALERGRAWGLNRLEPVIRERLAQPDAP